MGFLLCDWESQLSTPPYNFVDPSGEIGIAGAVIGVGIEIGIQAFSNYSKGCDVLDYQSYDWADVAVEQPGWQAAKAGGKISLAKNESGERLKQRGIYFIGIIVLGLGYYPLKDWLNTTMLVMLIIIYLKPIPKP